jgi:ABC-2 type transport system ATP-binding protein
LRKHPTAHFELHNNRKSAFVEPSVSVSNLTKNYAGEHALAGISFAVPRGCLFGMVGADGAGKTTLLRILTTLCNFDNGAAAVLGKDVVKGYLDLRKRIGYMPQKFSLYQDLTVRENLLFFADIFGVKKTERKERMDRLLSFSRLGPFQNRRSRDLSGGMKQKLALSCTLIHTPEILFLDEPTTGVDPVSRREFWEILFDLKKQGITIIVSTPYMDEAQRCDELLFLHHGAIMKQGSPDDLLGAYPCKLFSVESGEGPLSCAHDAIIPGYDALLYPADGNLHVAVKNGSLTAEEVLSLVKTVAPGAETCRAIAPKIEDLFIYLLSGSDKKM